jgi:hypothetical protein
MKKYATSVYTENRGFKHSKRFKSVIIPLIAGEKIIPEVSFSYFDPDSKEYVYYKTQNIKVNISSGYMIKIRQKKIKAMMQMYLTVRKIKISDKLKRI